MDSVPEGINRGFKTSSSTRRDGSFCPGGLFGVRRPLGAGHPGEHPKLELEALEPADRHSDFIGGFAKDGAFRELRVRKLRGF